MLTKGAIGNLVNRYKAVLAKCNLINTFGSLAVAAMLVMGGAGVASAAVLTAGAGGQYATLAEAVTAAQNGDTVKLLSNASGAGVAVWQSAPKNITIDLNGNTYTVTSPAVGSTGTVTQAVHLEKGSDITIINGTITSDGSETGNVKMLVQNYSDLTLKNVTLDGSKLLNAGTGRYVLSNNNGTITIDELCKFITTSGDIAFDVYDYVSGGYTGVNVTVHGDAVTGRVEIGGGDNATLTINGGTIKNLESSTKGGAIYVARGSLNINSTRFTGNKATGDGGAIYNDQNSTLTISGNSSFANNEALATDGWGGAIFNMGTLNIQGTKDQLISFTGNKAKEAGGAIGISKYSTSTTINYASFTGNNSAAYDGGAIINMGQLTLTNSIFDGNSAESIDPNNPIGGGAIGLGSESKTQITDTSFSNNTAAGNGGAIASRNKDGGAGDNKDAGLTIAGNTTFTGNTAQQNGGALFNAFFKNHDLTKDAVSISDATFTRNSALNGGAIYNEGKGLVDDQADHRGIIAMSNTTFIDNKASGLGGAIYNAEGAELTLSGTNTFSGNTDSSGANDIHNLGTLTIEGTTTFDGGVTGEGTMNVAAGASIVLDNPEAKIENKVEGTAAVSGSGKFNDQGGTLADLEAAFTNENNADNAVKATGIAEGLISGAVDASGKQTPNTVMQDTLDMATAAPLAISRIVMNDVRKRMGDLRSAKEESGVWMRWEGGKLKGDEGLTNNFNTIQVGADTMTGLKNVRAGVAAAFTHGDLDHRNGEGENETFSFSAYGTWMADNGMFADVIARVGFSNTETTVKGTRVDLDNEVLSLSGEYGWRLPVCNQFFVEPQVELTYTYVTSADSKVQYATYDIDSVDSLIGRAGLVAGWNLPDDMGNVYARASVVREFLGDAKITGSALGNSEVHELDGEDTWLEYGIGANVKLTEKTYIWADVERTAGADLDEEWRGTVGVRFSF